MFAVLPPLVLKVVERNIFCICLRAQRSLYDSASTFDRAGILAIVLRMNRLEVIPFQESSRTTNHEMLIAALCYAA